jgi:hypothetical protein
MAFAVAAMIKNHCTWLRAARTLKLQKAFRRCRAGAMLAYLAQEAINVNGALLIATNKFRRVQVRRKYLADLRAKND